MSQVPLSKLELSGSYLVCITNNHWKPDQRDSGNNNWAFYAVAPQLMKLNYALEAPQVTVTAGYYYASLLTQDNVTQPCSSFKIRPGAGDGHCHASHAKTARIANRWAFDGPSDPPTNRRGAIGRGGGGTACWLNQPPPDSVQVRSGKARAGQSRAGLSLQGWRGRPAG